MANRYDITQPVADQLRAVRDDYLMATPDKQDTAYAVMTRAAAALEQPNADKVAEVMDEGDGFWRACSGCQESVDGYVSTRDYPRSALFRCQPGAGCRECGGLGVIWDNTDYGAMAAAMLADEEACVDDDPMPDLLGACQSVIPKNLATDNRNIPDDQIIPLDFTMGELRRIQAAIAKAMGSAA